MLTKNDKTLYSDCCQYAIKYISRYPKTEKELRIKLQQKGYDSQQIKYTMDCLKEKGFIDDRIFVESYIRSELVNKGKPIINVRQKLYLKGVDKSLVEEVLKEYQEDILSGIYRKIRKEIESYKKKGVEGFDIIQKLMRKGYKIDDIKYTINEFSE
ncbi:MAG TPA: regulatory protein RecX [Candidatus Absconditabacterales bacterium]|nr:regulatory protein RecX [Candidatus Absconditabacterales bacterium]